MVPNRSDWWRNGASLDMDFYHNRYMVSTTAPVEYTSLTAFITAVGGTFSRASSATYIDSSGVMQTAAADVPRLDYDPSTLEPRGILIEGGRTNSVRNSTMVGSVAGTPGTLPTTWATPNNLGTLSYAIIGSGTESGIPYLDLRISGTASTSYSALYFDTTTSTPASPGQTWTSSVYFRLAGGSLANISSITLDVTGRDASGIKVEQSASKTIVPTSSPLSSQRFTVSGTLVSSSIARVSIGNIVYTVPGSSIDFTLRIGAPQLEQGAFATSYIATGGTAVTRAADNFTVSATTWYNPNVGTLFGEGMVPDEAVGLGSYKSVFAIDDGTINNSVGVILSYSNPLDIPVAEIVGAGSTRTIFFSALPHPSGVRRAVFAFSDNDLNASISGQLPSTGITGTIPSLDRFRVGGARGPAQHLNGWVRRAGYFPTRQPNHSLADYTR